MESLIQKLETSKESCHEMINMLHNLQISSLDNYEDNKCNNISYLKGVYGHCKIVQTTLDDALFMLRSHDFIQDITNMRRPKMDMNDFPNHFCKIEGKFGGEIPKHVTPSKDRRGCYKRRRNEQGRVIETMNLSDDGHSWRKYGQKPILHSTHPRNYYRCTHKHDEECQATKQVQQISENPPKYRIIYHGEHTCKAAKTPKNNNQTILFNDDNNQNSSILLSFDTGKHQALNNYSLLFPTSTIPPSSSPSSSSSGVTFLTGSPSLVKEEVIIASEPLINSPTLGGTHNNQCTSSSPDQYNNVHGMVIDECYSNILADDLINLHDLYDD